MGTGSNTGGNKLNELRTVHWACMLCRMHNGYKILFGLLKYNYQTESPAHAFFLFLF
jgi:hypothetical protein